MDENTRYKNKAQDENEYGISRGFSKNGVPYWCVTVGRRRRLISRSFFDGVYGSEEALSMARSYRDAVMEIIPPKTNLDMSTIRRTTNSSGIVGVHSVLRDNDIVAWMAALQSKGVIRRKNFSVADYGERGAKEAAAEQRQTWLEELDVAFWLHNDLAEEVAEEAFPEYLEASVEPLTIKGREIERRLAELNARFDTLRPLWVSVRVGKAREGKELSLYVTDGGLPARKHLTGASLHKHAPGAALAILRAKAALLIGDMFGEKVRECFLAVHGEAFNAGRLDPEKGFSIRERPEAVRDAARRKGNRFSGPIDTAYWLECWEVESWRENRPLWSLPDKSLYALADYLDKLTSWKPPIDPTPPVREERRTDRHRDAGVGVFRDASRWKVAIKRQGRTIRRTFSDVKFDSPEAGLEAAKAYRDAVVVAIPDSSARRKLGAHRASDNGKMPGVRPVARQGVVTGWCAQLNSDRFGVRREFFALSDYSEEEAKERAMACRRKWLEETFEATEGTQEAKPFDDQTFAAILRGINERFG